MSILNVGAVVSTLKWMVPPLLTLMSVANPWMVLSPLDWLNGGDSGDGDRSHWLGGFPGKAFSQTIGFGCVPHDPWPCTSNVDAAPETRTATTHRARSGWTL